MSTQVPNATPNTGSSRTDVLPGPRWLPSSPRAVSLRVFAWLSFIAEVVIVGTGGAVRLTGSGLGCPTWPTCTADSLVPTAELSFHSLIEFGNRMMSGVVGILALVVLILVWRLRRQRRELFVLAWIVVGGVIAEALVGGLTVRTGLNPAIVGFHYVASVVLVCVAAAFLARLCAVPGPRDRAVPRWFAILTHVTTLVLAVVVIMGVLTTASGPHSGDAEVVRQGFDAAVLAHIHSLPAYLLAALVLVLTVAAWALRLPPARWLTALVVVIAVQIVVGIVQARDGLPPALVGVHMVLAALLSATMTVTVLSLKRPAGGVVSASAPERETAGAA